MAKTKTSNNSVRDRLIADAKTKLAAAEDAARAAKAAFEGASNPEDQATAQAALNAATEEFQRLSAELDALFGDDDADDGEDISAIARTAIKHDGDLYRPGETITATRKAIGLLVAAGAATAE